MSNKFKGQPLFNEVENPELKAWNRAAVFFNMFGDQGKVPAQMYVAQFSEDDRKAILAMFERVKVEGYNQTRAAVMRQQAAVLEA